MNEKIIEINHLRKSFGENEVLKDISVTVNKGEVVTIIGSSGSGKSTFLRCINLLEKPTGGEIIYNGENVLAPKYNLPKYRTNLGMVFQSFNLFNNMNVLENCMSGQTTVLKRDKETAKKVAIENLEKVGMDRYVEAKPAQLSGGQKQRVAIAGVLAMKPDCIVLDEPTAMLDPKGRKEVMDTIHELNKTEGITIVLITHFMEEAVTADHILVIDKGVLKMEGTPREIFSQADKVTEIGLDVPVPADLARRLRKKGMAVSEKCMTDEELGEALCPFVSKM